ncbi:hypothetical protein LJC58_06355 [Lachnospiraceae bacterium OttesenSCG-928-D06]|nr:hypothetical protein [Lachnospiraceae bacterium OttesenSCG-928-D06]
MKQLTIGRLFELYIDTLNQFSNGLTQEDDLDIENSIFDVFFGGIISYFYSNSLEKLKNEGMIDELIEEKSLELRLLVLDLRETDYWDIETFKTRVGWEDIIRLCSELKKLVMERWSQEDLNYLFTH